MKIEDYEKAENIIKEIKNTEEIIRALELDISMGEKHRMLNLHRIASNMFYSLNINDCKTFLEYFKNKKEKLLKEFEEI